MVASFVSLLWNKILIWNVRIHNPWVFGYNMNFVSKFCEILFVPNSFRLYPRTLKVVVTQHNNILSTNSDSMSCKWSQFGAFILPCIPDSYPHGIIITRCPINTVVSPDDGHIFARKIYIKAIHIPTKIVHQFFFIYKIIQGCTVNKTQN